MYNDKTKKEFLKTIDNEDVKKLYASLFRSSESTELLYEKDLYSFNLSQLTKVIKNINPATQNSVTNTKSRINNYITWAIQNGRRASNINPLHGTTKEWNKSFIDTVTERYLSETEIYDLTNSLINYQDKALVQCIFEGVSGRAMSELISMRANNIDWENNELTVKDEKDKDPRVIKVSDRCIKFLKKAYNQKYYVSEITENETELVGYEDYILKNTKWKNTQAKQVSRGNLAKRLYIIKDKFGFDALTVNTLSESGRIKLAYDLYRNRGKLDKEEFHIIGETFNLGKMFSNNYSYYDTTKMKTYINQQNLKELYNLEIDM